MFRIHVIARTNLQWHYIGHSRRWVNNVLIFCLYTADKIQRRFSELLDTGYSNERSGPVAEATAAPVFTRQDRGSNPIRTVSP